LFHYSGPGVLQGKCEVLARHGPDLGPDPRDIEHPVLSRLALARDGGEAMASGETSLSVAPGADKRGKMSESGTGTVSRGMANDTDPAAYTLVGELVEQVARL